MTKTHRSRSRALTFALHYLQMIVAMVIGMMVIPMAAWMRFRGHGWRPVVEMSAAMYAGFVAFFPFLWLGAIDGDGLMLLGHVLMLLLMLAAMLARPGEYSGHHAHHAHAHLHPTD
ncbi:hypothetical protein G5C66_00125 [Nocardioides sp. KC13]|uniref:Uncharacterized protein n=1 Tax=Nocardioides turkmenicus TaxID=2711220 RepID=A0A6M1R3R3_9ACTN|nr:hypothetical protein [Nocardioides sp. KC13]NGN91147.1 hypothetical protein [Nocardioides sp. KC13]